MWLEVVMAASALALVASSPLSVMAPSSQELDPETNEIPPRRARTPFVPARGPYGQSADPIASSTGEPTTELAFEESDTTSVNSPSDSTPEMNNEGDTETGTRFRVHEEPARWMEALRACWEQGERLAAPRSQQEARDLGRLLADANVTNADSSDAVFVGANSLAYAGNWRTADGNPLWTTGYAEWLGGQPRGGGRCGALLADGRYVAQPCGARLIFACEDSAPTSALLARNNTSVSVRYTRLGAFGRYRVGDAPARWVDAAAACAREGAALALPRSAREAGALAAVLLLDGQQYFVGATDLADEGTWRADDGSTLEEAGYGAWVNGEPSGGRRKNCAAMQADGLLTAETCTSPLPYICRVRAPAADPRHDGYGLYQGLGRYRLHPEGRTWFDAVTVCHKENASLAIPHSVEEARLLIQLLNNARGQLRDVQNVGYMHVGLHDIDGDGDWRTLDGETTHEAGYHNWWRGWSVYPQNNGDHCVLLDNERLSYFNYPCSNRYAFVCQKPL